jgi:hypothetical protein
MVKHKQMMSRIAAMHFRCNPVSNIQLLTRKERHDFKGPNIVRFEYYSKDYEVADVIFNNKNGNCSLHVQEGLRGRMVGMQVLEQVRQYLQQHGVHSISWNEYGLDPVKLKLQVPPGFDKFTLEGTRATMTIDKQVQTVRFKWSESDRKMVIDKIEKWSDG